MLVRLIAGSLFTLALTLAVPEPLRAQQTGWIQIEAHPDLATARQRARLLAGRFGGVRGFRLDTGWYAIALGPLGAETAQAEVQRLRRTGLVPGDSYVTDGQEYRDPFWPSADAPQAQASDPEPPSQALAQAGPGVIAPPEPVEETLAEARRGEAALDLEARKRIQAALAWFGFYQAGIDGAFGRGTRLAMADWQQARGLDPTGVLTTAQRRSLLEEQAVEMDRLGLRRYRDEAAGIEITLPLDLVRFDRHEPPFAHFEPASDDGVRALLISMPGDVAALAGLYEVMQSLEIVPPEGERALRRDSFALAGRNARIASQTHAWLERGAIKGFTLVWPRALDRTMERVLPVVRESFRATGPAVLDDRLDGPAGALAGVDLIAGLETRRPRQSRSGVFIDERGTTLTASEAVRGCARVTIEEDIEAEVLFADDALGIAVLRPLGPVAPAGHASFASAPPNGDSEIAVSGFSYGGSLGAPTLTWGRVATATGLAGETALRRLAVAAEPGDTGGPVLDMAGRLAGILLGGVTGTRQLPPGMRFAAASDVIAARLLQGGIEVGQTARAVAVAPEDLAVLASEMTVLVSCWD